MKMKFDLVEIEAEIRVETYDAVQIHDGKTLTWLPKSQVKIERAQRGDNCIVTMPKWLAQERGLI
jgi:hypothetical protein